MPGRIVKHDQCDPTFVPLCPCLHSGPSLQVVEEWREGPESCSECPLVMIERRVLPWAGA